MMCKQTSQLGIASRSHVRSGVQPAAGMHNSTLILFSFLKIKKQYNKTPFKTTSGATAVHQCSSIYSRAEIQAYCAGTTRNKENKNKSDALPASEEQNSWQRAQIISRNDGFTTFLLSSCPCICFPFSVW